MTHPPPTGRFFFFFVLGGGVKKCPESSGSGRKEGLANGKVGRTS